MKNVPLDRKDEFWSMVTISGLDTCWKWNGRTINSGYGSFANELAHRFSFLISGGIEEKEQSGRRKPIMHSCDFKLCVNPAHLSSGSMSQNGKDAYARGLRRRPTALPFNTVGENHKMAKLTESMVLEIHNSKLTTPEICNKYGIKKSQARRIARKETWKHLWK